MKKLLVAIDGSECSLRAVDFVGRQFAALDGLRVTLLHILPGVPAELWDDGHILTPEERSARQKVLDKWLANRDAGVKPLFERAGSMLARRGFDPRCIETRSVPEEGDIAEGILNAARADGYDMLVVGRHGRSKVQRFLLGSVATKIINHAEHVAVCVVE